MKPTLPLFASLTVFLFACKKDETLTRPAEVAIQKHVEFRVLAAKDYSAPIYQNVKVDLRLQIIKTNYATGQQTVLWDSTFSTRKPLDFPAPNNPLVIKKYFSILDRQEKLTGGYAIKYNDEGYIKQEASFDEAGTGREAVLLEAHI